MPETFTNVTVRIGLRPPDRFDADNPIVSLAVQKLCAVEVGCVTEEGRVWVARAGGADAVRAALALLTAGPYRRPLPAAPHAPPAQPNTLYIVRTLAGDWSVSTSRALSLSPLFPPSSSLPYLSVLVVFNQSYYNGIN